MERNLRLITCSVETAEIRAAEFDGDPYLVVPVVALVGNAIVQGLHASTPEFVPAEELARNPTSWNGRPLVTDHPGDGTESANVPSTLEAMGVGQMFGTRYHDGRLKTEAWIDTEKAAALGGDAQDLVDRINAGEMIEVSVGAWVTIEGKEGEWDGKRYGAVWHDIVPDHLALLPADAVGACSNDMGCGGPRVNRVNPIVNPSTNSTRTPMTPYSTRDTRIIHGLGDVTPLAITASFAVYLDGGDIYRVEVAEGGVVDGLEGVEIGTPTKLSPDEIAQILTPLGISSLELSDADLRNKLWEQLHSSVPAFDGIRDVFQDSGFVVFWTWPEEGLMTWRQDFTVDGDEVTLTGTPEQVEIRETFEPVAAEGQPPSPSCSCNATSTVGDPMSDARELANQLIACESTPFTGADSDRLGALSGETLEALVGLYADMDPPPANPTPPADPDPAPPAPAQLSEEEWLATAPASVREVVARSQAEEAHRRSQMIGAILANQAGDAFNQEQLDALDTATLARLSRSIPSTAPAPSIDYSGLVLESPISTPQPSLPAAPPDGWGMAN